MFGFKEPEPPVHFCVTEVPAAVLFSEPDPRTALPDVVTVILAGEPLVVNTGAGLLAMTRSTLVAPLGVLSSTTRVTKISGLPERPELLPLKLMVSFVLLAPQSISEAHLGAGGGLQVPEPS